MATKAHGRILFWEGASLWILSAPPGQKYPKTDPHAHHVVQLTFALTGRVDFEGETERATGEAIAIAPSALHAFEGTGLVAHLFVASEGKPGRQIARQLFEKGPIASIPARLLGDLPARLQATFQDPRHTEGDLRALGQSLIARLAGDGAPGDAPDPRIRKLIEWVARRLDEAVSLSDAAALLGLSQGRGAPPVRPADGAPVQDLPALAAAHACGRALRRRCLPHDGGARRRLRGFGAFESDLPAHVRHRCHVTPPGVAPAPRARKTCVTSDRNAAGISGAPTAPQRTPARRYE